MNTTLDDKNVPSLLYPNYSLNMGNEFDPSETYYLPDDPDDNVFYSTDNDNIPDSPGTYFIPDFTDGFYTIDSPDNLIDFSDNVSANIGKVYDPPNIDYVLNYPNPKYSDKKILRSTKYVPKIKSLNEMVKERRNRSFKKYKEEIVNLFDRYKTNKINRNNKKGLKDLEENVLDIFNDLQGRQDYGLNYTEPKFNLKSEALNTTKRYELDAKRSGLSLNDPESALNILKPLIIEKLKENTNTKQQITVESWMEKKDPITGDLTKVKAYFHSRYHPILEATNHNKVFEEMKYKIKLNFESFIVGSSIWAFSATNMIFIEVVKINPLNGANHFPTPKFLASKNAIINPQNNDEKCLLWCVAINELLKTNPNLKNPGRITKELKEKVNSFNIKGMEFPCGFLDIDKFEKNNNIPINLFGYNEENKNHEIFPLRVSKLDLDRSVTNVNTHVNILLITNENEPTGDIEQRTHNQRFCQTHTKCASKAGKHYCLIKNMSRLFSNQVNKSKEKIHICNYCLQNFRNEKTLKNHLEYCSKNINVEKLFILTKEKN